MDASTILARLGMIAERVRMTGDALGFLALGSAGRERFRMDEFSDLDFFVIAKPAKKMRFLNDLSWLDDCGTRAFAFRNTVDGFKYIYTDGVMCEFAVFTPEEFKTAQYARGRFIWKDVELSEAAEQPRAVPVYQAIPPEDDLGEALTNLYVGLCRYLRGEKTSAFYFIEHYAVDHVLSLISKTPSSPGIAADMYQASRRFEIRYPSWAPLLKEWMQGYEKIPASARALLAYLEAHYDIPSGMLHLLDSLCVRASQFR